MTSTAAPPAALGTRLRALVVEPVSAVRTQVAGLLQRQGCDVHACENFSGGSQLYDQHEIIVAPVNGDNSALSGFVEQVRATSGDAQPYILGLTAGSGVGPHLAEDFGMNDILPWPVDAERLSTRLSAIVRQCAEQPRPAPH